MARKTCQEVTKKFAQEEALGNSSQEGEENLTREEQGEWESNPKMKLDNVSNSNRKKLEKSKNVDNQSILSSLSITTTTNLSERVKRSTVVFEDDKAANTKSKELSAELR
ncbi:hypothetical protein YC2023_104595 [Brassica napus]